MRFRKIIGVFLLEVIVIVSMFFTGCGGRKEADSENAVGSLEGKKIGMTLIADDGLFRSMYDYISSLAAAVGVELINDVGAFSPEDQVASVEKLITAGCDGIIYSNFGEESLIKIAQICDEAKVFWVQFCRENTDQDVMDVLNASKYYVGRTVEGNYKVGEEIAEEFHKKKLTKTSIIGPTPGDSTTDGIAEGYKKKTEEYGMEILSEIRNCEDYSDGKKAVEIILASFPDTEAIIVLSGSTGKLEGVLDGLDEKGRLGEISVASIDASKNITEDITAGYVDVCYTGQYVDPGFSFALLLNAIAGTPLSDEPIVIYDQHVTLRSQKDAENYEKYVENTAENIYAYTGEEFCQWLKLYNPNASVDLIQEAASKYSIADVMERHSS